MHRSIGNREVFALYNLAAGSQCFFRAKGSPELWNPWTGQTTSLEKFAKTTPEGTELSLPLSEKEIQLVIFNSEPTANKEVLEPTKILRQIPLGNDWEFELKPSLDNQWGDFQLPASNEMMGAQVRQLHYKENLDYQGEKLSFDDSWKIIICAYGKQFLKLGALPVLPSEEEILKMVPEKPGAKVLVSGKPYSWEEYGFSWQSGVEGDYGHQGYHGLKGNMYDNFIRLGALAEEKHSKFRKPEAAGNFYLLYSNVIAPEDGDFELLSGNEKPALLFINGIKTEASASFIHLKKGANPILAVYSKACETYFVFRRKDAPRLQKQQLCMSWYHDFGVLPFDYSGQQNSSGIFAFESAPGLQTLSFLAYGKVAVWTDGIQQETFTGSKQADGLTSYTVNLKIPKAGTSQIVMKIDFQPGYRGAAALPEYIRQNCGKGTISLGDWSEIDGLKAYSGGAWYRKTISLKPEDLTNKLELDLGDLVSSAEVLINGKSAGIKLAPPWKFDITKLVNVGENKIEVLIYNTLANNYTTVPTRYRGSIRSGLIGPVNLNLNERKTYH